MSFDQAAVTTLFDKVQSHAMTLGLFDVVNTHEPPSPPGHGLNASIWVDYMGPFPAGSGLDATSGIVTLMCRTYSPAFQAPLDEIDPNLLGATTALLSAYSGDFDLGGSARNIDLLGETGRRLESQAGYVKVGTVMYRCMDIRIPVIINDMWNMGV